MLDEAFVVGVLARVGFESFHARSVLAGFLLDLQRRVLGFDITKDHVGAGLREYFDGCRSDAARTAGDERRFTCERNHDTPDWKLKKLKMEIRRT
jgi:hypothetical protein